MAVVSHLHFEVRRLREQGHSGRDDLAHLRQKLLPRLVLGRRLARELRVDLCTTINTGLTPESASRKCVWRVSGQGTGPVGHNFMSEHCPDTLMGNALTPNPESPCPLYLMSTVTRCRLLRF